MAFGCESLEGRRYLADITVTTTADVTSLTDGVTSLREAVATANVLPGADRIILKGGEIYTLNAANGRPIGADLRQGYASQLTLTGDITIYSDGKPGELFGVSPTVIDTKGNGRAFTVTGSNTHVTFDGTALPVGSPLTIVNGVADQGGAMLIQDGASVTTLEVAFRNNKAVGLSPVSLTGRLTLSGTTTNAVGGAVFVTGGANLTMVDSDVLDNSATGTAGGLALSAVGNGTAFYNAGSASGGGIAVDGGSLSLTRVNIERNVATGGVGYSSAASNAAQGGGISLVNSSVNAFESASVSRNVARVGASSSNSKAFGGGVYALANGSLAINGGRFEGNVVDGNTASNGATGASVYGGAIASYAPLALTDVEFFNNGANAGRGGEAVVRSGANNSIRPGNNGDASGGAVFAANALTVTRGIFVRNGVIGSAVDTLNAAPQGRGRDTRGGNGGIVRGGAVYVPSPGAAATFTDVTFDTNVALAAAGGLGRATDSDGYFEGYDHVNGQDGAPGGNGGSAYGGAITFDSNSGLTLTNSTFRSNLASGGRGGEGSRGVWGYDDGDAGGDGGTGGNGGTAAGGAVSYGGTGAVTVTGSKLIKNLVGAGDGGNGGYAGRGGSARSGGSFGGFGGNGGLGGDGGVGLAGAIYTADRNSQVVVATTALSGNDVRGGFGGLGGLGGAGLPGSAPSNNIGDKDTDGGDGGSGGNGGSGGSAYGGAIAASGTLVVRSSAISDNAATGGNSGSGGLGGYGGLSVTDADGNGGAGGVAFAAADAFGGGVYGRGTITLDSSTVVRNAVNGGAGGNGGSGGAAPGGKVDYKPTGVGVNDDGKTFGGQAAIGGSLLTIAAVSIGGLITANATLAFISAGIGFAAASGVLAGGVALAPVLIAGTAILGTYGVFGILSSVSAIQALIGGGDAGSAFATTFADLNRYGSPADNADGPNAAKLFDFNSTSNRTRGYGRPAGADGDDANGHGGGVFALAGVTLRNSIVATNSASRSYLAEGYSDGVFAPVIVYGDDGFPTEPIPTFVALSSLPDQVDVTVGGGELTSNGRNLIGVTPKGEGGSANLVAGDKSGTPSAASSYSLKPAAYDDTFSTLPIAYTTESARDAGQNLGVTTTDQLGNARNRGGTEDIGAVELISYDRPAYVSSVWVSSTSWSQAFKDQLLNQGLATPSGFVYVNPNRPLPWTNIDQIQVNFDRAVKLTANSLADAGLTGYAVTVFTDFGGGTSGRFTFGKAFTGSLTLKFDPRSVLLPGQVLEPSPFTIVPITVVNIVRGDADGSGSVTAADVTKIRAAVGTSTTLRSTVYSVWFDLDGDGKVAANDLTLAQARVS